MNEEEPQMPDWQIILIRGLCLFGVLLVMAGCTELLKAVAR